MLKSLIVVDKPHGITSMTVVRILRKILKPTGVTKIGYAGTLDPYATGVLIVGIGRHGTRQLGTLTDKDKEYICEIDFLKNSNSGDMEDFKNEYQMEMPNNINKPSLEQITTIIQNNFIGSVTQIPPNLSAIKINGKKACDMVREGIYIEMQPRVITIFEIEILSYDFPILKLRVKCSKGTYIRTLGKDIGNMLGLWGTLTYLKRTRCGDHDLSCAYDLNKITINDLLI